MAKSTERKHKTALVLEGGAMRGMYTAGVLDVFMRNNINFDAIIGVSAGALFGVNYLSKQPGRVIRYNKKYNSDKWYTEWAILDHYDIPTDEDQEYSTGYFYYTGKDGKKYEYIGKVSSSDREEFRNKKEYKKLIYVSETDNSKSMKYENYSTKYEFINSFVSPIVLGAIIISLVRVILLVLRLIFTRRYIK